MNIFSQTYSTFQQGSVKTFYKINENEIPRVPFIQLQWFAVSLEWQGILFYLT
jgi:hypothetical protein